VDFAKADTVTVARELPVAVTDLSMPAVRSDRRHLSKSAGWELQFHLSESAIEPSAFEEDCPLFFAHSSPFNRAAFIKLDFELWDITDFY